MKISTILDHIDNGHMALPEFQRGYVWNRDQVRGLFDSLYRRHPVGGLLVWVTSSQTASHRGDGPLSPGVVKLLLDGQQRITTLYGVVRGTQPRFFDGNPRTFTDLRFHLETETFAFYQPIKMSDDPLWIDVTELMKRGSQGMAAYINEFQKSPQLSAMTGLYVTRLSQLLGINDIDLHIEEVTGQDKSLDVVVDIFNRVNSGGTKLSKGDLALARICADWPEARDTMKDRLNTWKQAGFEFDLDWLLRSVNTVTTGEAKFLFLHDLSAAEIQNGLERACKQIDRCLNMISGRLGLDHDRVLFSRFAVPVMVHYLDQRDGFLTDLERDKLLFWFLQTGMWGRFSGSTESHLDQDIEVLSGKTGGLDPLLEQLRLWHGGLRVEAGHFTGWSLSARFYPVLYWLTRTGAAQDWGSGLPLRSGLLGRMSRLEVHHIFPKAQLYKAGHKKPNVNALGNYCFQTKETNLHISDRLPEDYFPEIEERHPGALASQWIPTDPELWKIGNYLEFLERRKQLLAEEANKQLANLLHGNTAWLEGSVLIPEEPAPTILGFITDKEEEAELEAVNNWMQEHGLPPGIISFEYSDPETGQQKAIFDLAWPTGVQEELSEPVALAINEPPEILRIGSQAGIRCFTSSQDFKQYVLKEILAEAEA